MSEDPNAAGTSRRSFIRKGAAAAIALPTLASVVACERKQGTGTSGLPAAPPQATLTAAPAATPDPRVAAEEMDAMHEKGMKAFPAKTEGKGNQLFEPRMEGRVKVYELTAEEIEWEVSPGQRKKAWTYNRQLPGPSTSRPASAGTSW